MIKRGMSLTLQLTFLITVVGSQAPRTVESGVASENPELD